MGLETVGQLQALSRIMKEQFERFPEASTVAVLGVAGGNGLKHCCGRFEEVYGIDINEEYLSACQERYGPMLDERLKLLNMDLTKAEVELPPVDLVIADLVIEYLGVKAFCAKICQTKYVSCVIQRPDAKLDFVSTSPYQQSFQSIGKLHQDVDRRSLVKGLDGQGYELVSEEIIQLPNGKSFHRIDCRKRSEPGEKNASNIIQNEYFV